MTMGMIGLGALSLVLLVLLLVEKRERSANESRWVEERKAFVDRLVARNAHEFLMYQQALPTVKRPPTLSKIRERLSEEEEREGHGLQAGAATWPTEG